MGRIITAIATSRRVSQRERRPREGGGGGGGVVARKALVWL